MYNRWSFRRTILGILLILQLLLISTYFYTQLTTIEEKSQFNNNYEVKFLFSKQYNVTKNQYRAYHVLGSKITLKTLPTNYLYADLNSSLCYKNGTALDYMKRDHSNWKCECLPAWHGIDCSQPEAIWRALIAYRKPTKTHGPRKHQRRIIYIFTVDTYSEPLADIRIHELNNTVDLFVLCDIGEEFDKQLNKGVLKEYHSKILYLKGAKYWKRLWKYIKSAITNLNHDDIVLISNDNEIPYNLVVQFMKLHNDWPQPIRLRLRWTFYGFFWLHPEKTIVTTGACTVGHLSDNYSDNIELLLNSTQNTQNEAFIVGDLNHYGGWYCDFCIESSKIIDYLKTRLPNRLINWDTMNSKQIDNSYIEDLIQNGVHLNGKTNLLRVHRSQELYYAPQYVAENTWLYDWLLVNMYNIMDY